MDAGQQLFEARQRRGLTLDDISRTTKIPVSLLTAVERNDTTRLPHGFFARGFVRAYAREVGLNGDDLLDTDDVEQVVEFSSTPASVEEPASSRSFLFVAAIAAVTIYYGYTLEPPAARVPAAGPAIVEPVVTAASERGDIALPAAPEPAPTAPVAPPRPVVQHARHEPIAESIDAIFDVLPASALEVLPTVPPPPAEQF